MKIKSSVALRADLNINGTTYFFTKSELTKLRSRIEALLKVMD